MRVRKRKLLDIALEGRAEKVFILLNDYMSELISASCYVLARLPDAELVGLLHELITCKERPQVFEKYLLKACQEEKKPKEKIERARELTQKEEIKKERESPKAVSDWDRVFGKVLLDL